MEKYDFGGWATRNDIQCSDGRTIRKDAFKHNDGLVVPLVWNHNGDDPNNVLGHAMLENREEGVYTYGKFNDTEQGKNAKLLVEHGDIVSLSIYANRLKQQGGDVLHGEIREVSLVLAGANPGAYIETLNISHSEGSDDGACIYTGEDISLLNTDAVTDESIEHSDEKKEDKTVSTEKEKTIQDAFDEFTDEQKNVVYALVGAVLEENGITDDKETDNEETEGGKDSMKHNAFDNNTRSNENVLTHSDVEAIFNDAKRYGSLRDAVLSHAENNDALAHAILDSKGESVNYGIADIDYLFPEAKALNTPPAFISRDMGWVTKVMRAVHNTPFSRIKSVFADITEADARAKGYVKGNRKVEEVFGLLKRTTTPTTLYKKQKLDRDDVADIIDFDVVAWLKAEMRLMLDEEIARAILVGDGRSTASNDKINEQNIRPIWTDDKLYTIKTRLDFTSTDSADVKAKKFIRGIVKARKDYNGSGNPSLFTTEDVLTDCLLMEDATGRIIYDSVDKLATALRVKEIVTVPVMEGLTREGVSAVDGDTDTRELLGILVNLSDYNVGADKGGAVNMFDDFDIDYNQQKYLIETRCSGALTKPYSAIAIEAVTSEAVAG